MVHVRSNTCMPIVGSIFITPLNRGGPEKSAAVILASLCVHCCPSISPINICFVFLLHATAVMLMMQPQTVISV